MFEVEFGPKDKELEQAQALQRVIDNYIPDDQEFLAGMDFEETVSYVYGALIDMGYDPDKILNTYGVTEEE